MSIDSANEQLLMLVIGQGGCGKSVLIDGVTETFEFHGKRKSLAKCATSGVAAIQIKGQTIHSWAGIGVRKPKAPDWVQKAGEKTTLKRKRNILGKECLIIDEISMMKDTLLSDVAEVVASVKRQAGEGNDHLPFNGMHVILFGDFHQFPPVGNPSAALYSRSPTTTQQATQGRGLYKLFDTVVELQQQIRVQDQTWIEFLNRLRVGECTSEDIAELRKLVLSSEDCPETDFETAPWDDAILVTSRHSVQEAWNDACLKSHCARKKVCRYIIPAEDTLKDGSKPAPLAKLKIAELNEKTTGGLPDRIEIAVGMKAMVTLNLATEADVANGTRGIIEDIILDPREPETITPDAKGRVQLAYPPALILFRPNEQTDLARAFPNSGSSQHLKIEPGLVPLTPSSSPPFSITCVDGNKFSIYRRQFALTAAYAFTDIKAQGQTIPRLIADLAKPPTGHLSPFSTYVTLSRCRGRDNIRLLRDFDETLFLKHPNEDLREEMLRLKTLETHCRM